MPGGPDRIVLFEVGWLGDTLVTVPAMRAMRRAFPQAEIVRIVSPAVLDLMTRCPYVDRLLVYDRLGEHRGPTGGLRLLRAVRALRPAVFVNLHVPDVNRGARLYWRDNLFARLTGAPVRCAYAMPMDARLLTHPVRACPVDRMPITVLIGRLLTALGVEPGSSALEAWADPADEAQARELLRACGPGGPVVVVQPGSKRPSRRWDPGRFAALADWLADRWQARILLAGSRAEAALLAEVAERMRARALVLDGALGLPALYALLREADLFVGNDSGVFHLAVAAGTPSVGLFGPGNVPRWTRADTRTRVLWHGAPCSPCYRWQCDQPTHRCMEAISFEEAAQAAGDLLRAQDRHMGTPPGGRDGEGSGWLVWSAASVGEAGG